MNDSDIFSPIAAKHQAPSRQRRFNAPVSSRAIGLTDGGARQNGLIGSSAKPLTAAFTVRRIDGGIWVVRTCE